MSKDEVANVRPISQSRLGRLSPFNDFGSAF